jgi:outer membrane protein assembly factor BamE (lipoprotein component of BamABCDE complex)
VYRSIRRKIPLPASFAVALASAALSACVATVDQRGNLPEPDRLGQIQPGTTTREQVAKILGTPSSTGVFDDKNWYYISRRTKQLAFFDPDVLDQQVYIVNFDDKGVVRGVDHKELKDGREIAPAPGATPAPGRELTFLEQVLGNIGRFSKGGGSGGGGTSSPGEPVPGKNPS